MSQGFTHIAGVVSDGSAALGSGTFAALTAAARDAGALVTEAEGLAAFGFGTPGTARATFFMAGNESCGPLDEWASTPSVSQFGEGGQGSWAAARIFPEAQKVWLARDQFGQRPLYYVERGGVTAFSTDLEWLFASGIVRKKIHPDRFGELVQLQFSPGANTLFEGVARVLPGETLIIERGRVVDRLRRPPVPLADRRVSNLTAALDALDGSLTRAIREAIPRDGVIGCLLTGDLASTALAVALARCVRRRVRAYVPCDGSGQAAGLALAKELGFEAVPLRVDKETFWKLLPVVEAGLTEPIGDYMGLVWHLLAEAAKRDGAHVLLPTGGQELFAAYGRYRSAARPAWLGGRAMRQRGHLQGIGSLGDGPSNWRDALAGAESRYRGGSYTRTQRLQLVDLRTWLPNDTMLGEVQLVERAGVTVSRPFLAPDMAGLAFALADHLKIARGKGGMLLRHWIAQTYPTALPLLNAPRLRPPLADWLSEEAGEMKRTVDRVISVSGLMARGQARSVFNDLDTNRTKHAGMAGWQLLSFALWHRLHLEGAASTLSVHELLQGDGEPETRDVA